MKLIDSHCHINDKRFKDDFDDLIKRMENDLEMAVNIGYDLESSRKSVEFADKYGFIYATVGFHPCDIKKYSEEAEVELENLLKNPKVLAVGEIGLDYHWMEDPKELQKEIFQKQLNLARRVKKPVVIHTREAIHDTIEILNENRDIFGIMHCYPGSFESAKLLMDRFYFGVGGVVTFKNAKSIKETVKELPIERIVLETDAPYLTPSPYRGKRNEPSYVEYVAREVAKIKEMEYEDVVRITNENVKRAYGVI